MDIEQDTIRYIPLNKLFPSTHNARKTKRAEGIPELAASILAHGLRQNLNVVERRDGKYEVNAGGRRLAALKLLAKEGKIAKDFAVLCKLTAEDSAQEISLTENIQRVAMDVMDEVEAFASLAESGLSTDDIARRFGATLRHIEQRLALAKLSPKLRNAYRKGDLSLDAARAFCLAADQESQERLFKQMAKPITHAPSVRRAITQGRIDSNDRVAKFVGLEIYQQAGGQLRRDLFDESCILIEDGALMNRLARDRLQLLRESIAQEGWGWIDVLLDQPASDVLAPERLRPQQRTPTAEETEALATLEAEIADLDAQLEASEDDEALWAQRELLDARWDAMQEKLTHWVPEHMALAGVSLDIGHNGEPRVTRGLIKRADLKALNKLRRAPQDDQNCHGEEPDEAGAPDGKEHAPRLPQKLVEQLTSVRTRALRSEIAAHPKAALALLVHTLLLQRQTRFGFTGLDIRITPSAFQEFEAFETQQKAFIADAPASLEACFASETDDLLAWLAILIAEAFNVTHRHACAQDGALQKSADSVASLIDLDMTKYWAVDEDFWLQAPKALALETLAVTPKIARMGAKDRDALLAQYAKKKKSELATIACEELQGAAWLPDILITPPREGGFEITPAGENALAAKAA